MKVVKSVVIASFAMILSSACDIDLSNLTDRNVDIRVIKSDQVTTVAVNGNMLSIANEHAQEIAFALLDGTKDLSFDATYAVQSEIEDAVRRDAVVEAVTYDIVTGILDGVNSQSCVDSDGDGWGWDGTMSCLSEPSVPVVAGACIDSDGDGWGWDGLNACLMSDQEIVVVEAEYNEAENDGNSQSDAPEDSTLFDITESVMNDESAFEALRFSAEQAMSSSSESAGAAASSAGLIDAIKAGVAEFSSESTEATDEVLFSVYVDADQNQYELPANGQYVKISWDHFPEVNKAFNPGLTYRVYVDGVEVASTADDWILFNLKQQPELASGCVEIVTTTEVAIKDTSAIECYDFTGDISIAIDQ